MAHLARLAAVAALALVALAARPAASQACPSLAFDQMCIDQPPVRTATTDTGITIPKGSWVQITADGCVQTGGSGATWKRYVDPDPPGGSNNHFGSIGILSLSGAPNFIPAGTRFSDISPILRFRVITDSKVKLGYQDDGYGDNGYNDHDNGTNNQCSIPS